MNAAQFSVTLLAVMIALGVPIACADYQMNPDVPTANAAALTIETAQRIAEANYFAAQQAVLEESRDRATFDAKIAIVREQWKPVWAAFKRARVAHAALTQAIELGEDTTAAVLELSKARKDLETNL